MINQTPSRLLKEKTPYELIFNEEPKYDHIRVFGCMCFARNKVGDKFASRSQKCVFVRYPFGKKGWKLYDLEENKFFESRDVRFCEEIFPFASHDTDKSQDIFPTPKLDNMWIDEENGSAKDASPVNNPIDVVNRGSCGQQSTILFGSAEAASLTPEAEPEDSAPAARLSSRDSSRFSSASSNWFSTDTTTAGQVR